MPTVRWLGPGVFTDHRRGFEFKPDTDHEVDEDTAEELLNHEQFSHRFERVDHGDAEEATTSGSDNEETADETSGDETGTGSDADADADAEPASDDPDYETHNREALEEMDYSELQTLARESNHPDIDGRSSGADIIDALADEE